MHALILAAGFGTRMGELTTHTPKPLLPLGECTLIEHNIALLRQSGIEHIVINTHYHADEIIQHLRDYDNITFTKESQILESGGGIINALPHLSEEFIVINADVVTDITPSSLTLGNSLANLVLVNNPEHNPNGDFVFNDTTLTFSGVGLYNKELFTPYPVTHIKLATIIREHLEHIRFTHHTGMWYDIGTPERLKNIQQQFT